MSASLNRAFTDERTERELVELLVIAKLKGYRVGRRDGPYDTIIHVMIPIPYLPIRFSIDSGCPDGLLSVFKYPYDTGKHGHGITVSEFVAELRSILREGGSTIGGLN